MRLLAPDELHRAVATSLGVPMENHSALLRQLLRRNASLLAPSSQAALLAATLEPLEPLALGAELKSVAETALEDLLTYGDLLELQEHESIGSLIRPAPPTFVSLDGQLFLLGVAGEHPSALPADLDARVDHSGPVRRLLPTTDEDLAATLDILGFQELPANTWLRAPRAEPAEVILERWTQQLNGARAASSGLGEVEVLSRPAEARYYSARWAPLGPRHTGLFVARRTHAYGGRVWSLVELAQGHPVKLLDLETVDRHQRPCDLAWRLAAAMDVRAGHPPILRRRRERGEVVLQFSAPTPAFVERRLAAVGRKETSPGALFQFRVPAWAADAEISMLRDLLWMQVAESEETSP